MTNRIIRTLLIRGLNPVSTNKLYVKFRGGVRKSKEYVDYRHALSRLLPDNFLPNDMSKHSILFEMGITKGFDLDNTLKGIIDALQEKYGFNDNQLSHIIAKKIVIDPNSEDRFIKIHLIDELFLDDENSQIIDLSDSIILNEIEKFREIIMK